MHLVSASLVLAKLHPSVMHAGGTFFADACAHSHVHADYQYTVRSTVISCKPVCARCQTALDAKPTIDAKPVPSGASTWHVPPIARFLRPRFVCPLVVCRRPLVARSQ